MVIWLNCLVVTFTDIHAFYRRHRVLYGFSSKSINVRGRLELLWHAI